MKKHLIRCLEILKGEKAEINSPFKSTITDLKYRQFLENAQTMFVSCKKLLGAADGYLSLFTEDGTGIVLVQFDVNGEIGSVKENLPAPVAEIVSAALNSGKSVYENEFSDDRGSGILPDRKRNLENILISPLRIHKEIIGLFGFANKNGGFTEHDTGLVDTFVELAQLTFHNNPILEYLENIEKRLNSVTQSALDAIISTDSSMEIIAWNRGAELLFGCSESDVLGTPFDNLVIEHSSIAHYMVRDAVHLDENSPENSKTLYIVGRRKNGSEFPSELTFANWMIGQEPYYTFIVRDITERVKAQDTIKKALDDLEIQVKVRTSELSKANRDLKLEIQNRKSAEEKTRRHNEFLNNILESIKYPLFVIDAENYTIMLANSASGLNLKGGESITCFKHFYAAEKSCSSKDRPCPVSQIKKTGKPAVVEHIIYDEDGKQSISEVHTHPIFNSEGDIVQFIEYMIDITERKRAEFEYTEAVRLVEQVSRLASIGVMSSGINHEINQPLTAIKFNVDGLLYWEKRNKGFLPEMIVESFQDISEGIKRIEEIIKHMRSFYVSSTKSEKEAFDLNESVRNALSLVSHQLISHKVGLERDLKSVPITIHGNMIYLEQIVINLVINAMHALDETNRAEKKIRVTTSTEGKFSILEVHDNGPGLQNDDENVLFDPFYSTRQSDGGMGLGLAIVKHFVDMYEGTVKVTRNSPDGATFTVKLPLMHSL